MTREEKRKQILDAIDKAKVIVEKFDKPYSDKAWEAFCKKMNDILEAIPDKETQNIVYRIMSSVAEYCNKNLTEEVDE